MGNHDWYMAGGGFCLRSKSVNDCLVYLRKVITAENVEWLRSFPVQLPDRGARASCMADGPTRSTNTSNGRRRISTQIDGKPLRVRTHAYSGDSHERRQDVLQSRLRRAAERQRSQSGLRDLRWGIHAASASSTITQPVFDLMKEAGFSDYYYG